MRTIGYTSPLVPPEWIVAHGFQPAWMPLARAGGHAPAAASRGLCPYAGAVLAAALEVPGEGDSPHLCDDHASMVPASGRVPTEGWSRQMGTVPFSRLAALVMATTCDQVRHVAAVAQTRGRLPVFLLNVPAAWQSPAARPYYREELQRLGRFLIDLGGQRPSHDALVDVVLAYDRARSSLRLVPAAWPARRLAEAILEYRGGGKPAGTGCGTAELHRETPHQPDAQARELRGLRPSLALRVSEITGGNGVPLALVGGPLLPQDYAIFDLVELSGGRIVLDASETGQRTLPPPLVHEAVRQHPLEALADAYFLGIPDVFRRPDDRLYEWLAGEIASRGVRGLLLRRYVWCDLWHAQWRRLAEWSPVPVLEIDVAGEDQGLPGRTLARLEAFLETLQQTPGRQSGGFLQAAELSR